MTGPHELPAIIVCGWYTPDYRAWAAKLITSLDALAIPHDIVQVPKLPGGWEANTLAKPVQVLAAMDRHPDKVIVFLDVDCTVRGDLFPLALLRGDVAFRFRTRRKRGRGGFRAGFLSGTLVIKPNAHARRFVEAWRDCPARYGDTDQTLLALALGTVEAVSIEPLHERWLYGGVIAHEHASRGSGKLSVTAVRLQRLWAWLRGR
jgi:hypothetical protein